MVRKAVLRILALVLAALTVSSLLPSAALAASSGEGQPEGGTELLWGGAQAQLTMTYTPSNAYSSSIYYQNLREVKLTGDQRLDIINVALSQVGYHEGNSTSQLDGSNSSGTKNYTEYGYWFGRKVLGNDGGFFYEWCAMFVSWCARQAGIQKSVINNASYAHAGNNPYYFNVKYYSRGSYSPKPGDLIFYDWANTDRNWDHVGIICYIENGYIYAVEGNASEQVLIRRVSKNNYEIQGFGAPNYTSGSASALQVSNYTEPSSSLSSGSTGGGVKWLQCALLHLGYPCPVDGSFGANLKRQLKRFQKDVGLEVTGVCTANDRAAIRSRLGSGPIVSSDPNSYPVPTRTLKKGMTGEDVKWLQAVLKKMGASVTIDGGFGPATETKVKWAQKKLGLTADGIVGPATRKKLIAQVGGSSGSSGSGSSGSSSGYPVPTRTLKEGMSGDDVKWLQSALRKLGSAIPVTGYFGSATRASVVSFQRSKGLTADGIVGPATRAKLVSAVTPSSGSSGTSGYPEPTRTLRIGCKGNDVKWLQSALRGLGYTITVDGSFGPGTESVVKTFQSAVGLAVDGVVGPATRAQIKLKIQ